MRKIISIAGLVLGAFLSLSLASSTLRIAGSQAEVDKVTARLEGAKRERERLRQAISELESEAYFETQVRDKLGLAKEHEVVLVLPEDDVLRRLSPRADEKENIKLPDPVWKRWISLFM